MQLIILTGPPASGKLTIAKELSKKTKYYLIHNHAIIDFLDKFLEKDKYFWGACWTIRYELIKKAIKQKQKGLILTIALQGTKREQENIIKIKKLIQQNKGQTKIITLRCTREELQKRVKHKNRKRHGKITTKKDLDAWLENYRELKISTIKIDTSNTIKETLKEIIKKIKKS